MDAVEQLWAVYGKWKRLTEQEGLAIRQSNWSLVDQAQVEKRTLQPEIIHLTEQIHSRFSPDSGGFDTQMRGVVNELILLETQNNLAVQSCLAAANEERSSLEGTSNRLRQVHSRYVPSRNAAWENRG
jgi:hypothetical protein